MREAYNLARRLVLESREKVSDGSGGYRVAWRALGEVWADVSARTAREDFIAGQPRPRVRYRVIVRAAPFGASSRPRPEQRFREGERVFDIMTVAEADPRGRFLEIMTEEGLAS